MTAKCLPVLPSTCARRVLMVSFWGCLLTVSEHDFLYPFHVDQDSSFTHGKRVNVNA
jgi:hypothetical protein